MTGCSATAAAVKIMSATTTTRAVRPINAGSPLRCAISMKKAMPLPVPSMTVAPKTCANFKKT